MRQDDITYRDLGISPNLSKDTIKKKSSLYWGDFAGGDLEGFYPRPTVNWDNMEPAVFSQDAEPSVDDIPSGKMAFWEDTNDSNKLYLCYNRLGTVKTVELT